VKKLEGLSSNLSIVDQRIAARLHQKQIDSVRYAERMAYNLEAEIDSVTDEVYAMLAPLARGRELTEELRGKAIERLNSIGERVNARFFRDVRSIGYWSHAETVRIMATTVPRRWFRAVAPEVVLVGERVNLDPTEGDAPGVTGPAISPGQRLSDEEWQALLKEILFPNPTPQEVQAILDRPIAGQTTEERLRGLSKHITSPQRIIDELGKGLASGEALPAISKRLESFVGGVKASARRVARTESIRVAEQMNRKALEPMRDLMLGMQVIASLDENTRPHHALRHGTVYFYDGRRKPGIEELPDLPDEPNCRCFSSPVMKPPPEFENDPALRAEFQNAQGAAIPDPGAYTEWFRNADGGQRRLAVGAGRYREVQAVLNGSREPEWTDFVDENGKLLTKAQIQAETDEERATRKKAVEEAIEKRREMLSQVAQRGFVELKQPDGKPGPEQPTAVDDSKPAQAEEPAQQARPAFREGKTTKEAEQIARELNLADHVAHGKLHVSVANTINREVYDIQQRFPSVREGFRFIGSIQEQCKYGIEEGVKNLERENKAALDTLSPEQLKQWRAEAKKRIRKVYDATVPGNAYAVARPDFDTYPDGLRKMAGIGVNEKYAKASKIAETETKIAQGVLINWNPVGCDTMKSIVDHEIGHVIDFHLQIVAARRGKGFVDPVIRDFAKGKTVADFEANICRYAGTDNHEILAEAWAEYENNPEPREYAKFIGDRMVQLLEERNKQ